jgi:hypothetical protein
MKKILFFLSFLLIQTIFALDNIPKMSFDIFITNKNISRSELVNYQFYWQKNIPQTILDVNYPLVKKCIAKKDIDCIAQYIMFTDKLPNGTFVNYNSDSTSIQSLQEFSKNYNRIFTSNILNAVKTTEKLDTIKDSSDVGIILGDGELVFNYFCEKQNPNQCYFKIFIINAGSDTIHSSVWDWISV